MNKVKYYVIHNLDKNRYENILYLFSKYGVDLKDVTFINHPNKNELTYEIKKKAVQKGSKIKDGWISCSYKHYLAIEKIVENEDELAVVLEDNIGDFYEDIPQRLDKYLKELPADWDILYDSVWEDYSSMKEEKVTKEKLVYKKDNGFTRNSNGKIISHGGTRAAQFYFLNKNSAKKMYDNFLPFNHSADMWMNDVLRKANLNSYWSEPSLVSSKFNSQTSTNLKLSTDFFYILKSRLINIRLGIKSPIWPRKSYSVTYFENTNLEEKAIREKFVKKNDNTLNFLYCFDSNYHNQAFTSIHSLLENVSKKINIFVIHNREFSVTELPDSIANHNNLANFKSYKFVDKEHTFPNLENAHLSEATYYRLFIENYLPSDVEMLIYLDGDTVCINNPIPTIESQLKQLDESNKIIAARTEYTIQEYPDSETFKRLNMDSSYFNAGVLLINYRKWKENNLTNKLLKHMKKIQNDIVTWDQDVMNSLFNGDYVELKNTLNFNANSYDIEKEDSSKISILHYIGSKKPWLTSGALSYPASSNYYQLHFSKISLKPFHIIHKWRRASLLQFITAVFNLKIFKLRNPLLYSKELFRSFFY